MSRDSDSERKRLLQIERNAEGEVISVRRMASASAIDSEPPVESMRPIGSARLSHPPKPKTPSPPTRPPTLSKPPSLPVDAPNEKMLRLSGDDEATNPEMHIVTSVGLLESLPPGSLNSPKRSGRKYIDVAAVVTATDGTRIRTRTRKVSSRGLFLHPPSSKVELKVGGRVEVALTAPGHSVKFPALVVELTDGGIGLEIRGITEARRNELEKMLEATPEVSMKHRSPKGKRAPSRRKTRLPSLEAKEDDESDTMFATSSQVLGATSRGWFRGAALFAVAVVTSLLVSGLFALCSPPDHGAGVIDGAPGNKPIAIQLSAAPPEAKFQIDEGPLLSNPYYGVHGRDTEAHVVRAIADGFEVSSHRVSFGGDVTLNVTLEPVRLHKGGLPQTP